MIKVIKGNEPDNFIKLKKQNPNITNWEELNDFPEFKKSLRKRMINDEQFGLCPYCESAIDEENSSLEHVKPKDKYKNLLLDYTNLIVSCKSKNSCDNYKGNRWNDLFIHPVLENPQSYFTYDIYNGEITPIEKTGINFEKAKVTIEILNLNHKSLSRIRQQLLLTLEKLKEEDYFFITEQKSLVEFYKEFNKGKKL